MIFKTALFSEPQTVGTPAFMMPAFSFAILAMLSDHIEPATGSTPEQPHSLQQIKYFFFFFHGGDKSSGASIPVPLIDTDNYGKTPHAEMSFWVCHPDSAKFDHSNQPLADCR